VRFGYRVDGLPAPFAATDLAVVTEALQRPIHEASVPAPIGPSATGPEPLVELVCTDEHGNLQRIVPGKRTSIPFRRRDGCRVIVHRERFEPEDGTQDLTVEVEVTKVDDRARSDAHVNERMLLRPGPEPRIFWIKGVKAQFDRVTVRVAHVADDDRYTGARDTRTSLPAVQWTLVVGEGHLRFYATAAIPTGLFHITAPSGVLTLNFGALSRLPAEEGKTRVGWRAVDRSAIYRAFGKWRLMRKKLRLFHLPLENSGRVPDGRCDRRHLLGPVSPVRDGDQRFALACGPRAPTFPLDLRKSEAKEQSNAI
jgi:hypothetical protein